jgi:outer membrane PBP1 activator LpoA protein
MTNSLSLSQTDEAASIAANVLRQNLKRALVITPDNAWGERIRSAFTTAFEQGGGAISDAAFYDPATSDHSAMLTGLLRIDESNQRKADLQSRLGIPLVFEPIRREDFDFVFLAANPAEGRELKPLLRFHNVGDIPVFAMSRIFSGKQDRASDQDLNGVIFAATPWQLQTVETSNLDFVSLRGGAFGNLYALGKDAWNLLPWLALMQKDPDLWFAGKTGKLRLQSNGDLFRQPAWAQFSSGRPTPYEWPGVH